MKLIKSAEHKEIFELDNNIKRWVETWNTFVYLGHKIENVDIIPFDELKSYKVGDTKIWKTITTIVEGDEPKELFYPDEPAVPTRKMTVLGTVLTGCEEMAWDIGCRYIIGNGHYWGDHDRFEALGGKSIINLKPKPVKKPTEREIYDRIVLWRDRPGCGGWWIDSGIRGEEPDGQRQKPRESEEKMLADRIWFYEVVRAYDRDILNHPVVEQFDMTEAGIIDGDWRSGWKGQYREDPMTCDVNLWTCYTADEGTRAAMYEAQAKWFDVFPKKYMTGKVQLIPQVSVEHFWQIAGDNSVRAAYENWTKILKNYGWTLGGMAYYSWLLIKDNPDAQNAIREVNQEIMRG